MSDTATLTSETPAPAPSVGLADLSDTQYNDWLKSGDLPSAPAVEPASSALSADGTPPSDESPASETPVETASTEKPLGKPRNDVTARFSQLTEQKKAALSRAEAAEKRIAELEARATPPSQTAETIPSPAPASTTLDREPELDDFLSDPVKYPDPYVAHAKAAGRWAARQERAAWQAEQAQQAKAQEFGSLVTRTLEATTTKYPDFDPAPLGAITLSATLARSIYEHKHGADLLNHFSKNPAEGRELAAMGEIGAALRIGELAASFATQSTGVSSPPQTNTVSKAKPPSLTLGSRPTAGPPVDEVEAARQSGNYELWEELANRRDLAALKEGRG